MSSIPDPAHASALAQYEFEPGQEIVVAGLASKVRLAAVAELMLAAELFVLAATGYDTPRAINLTLLVVSLMLTIGGWSLAASRSLRSIVTTRGRDLSHLMAAMDWMTRAQGYIGVILLVGVFLVGYDMVLFLIRVAGKWGPA